MEILHETNGFSKSVAHVKVDAKDVKTYRADKIKQLKAELNELKVSK